MMYQFQCDYNEGAHPRILERLVETNFEQTVGYGEDHYCRTAADLIRTACGNQSADVHFLVGGTQTNATVISSILRPYQGVISAGTGHINVHETGAIEHGGHKVLVAGSCNGLLSAEAVQELMETARSIRSSREWCTYRSRQRQVRYIPWLSLKPYRLCAADTPFRSS